MSNAYRIHGARFLRKYSAADRSSIYSYMADVRKIANTLCKVPWTRVKADIPATTTIHTEEGLDWNEPERDRFDAAEWCGEHSDGFHRAFAQAACYVFKMPASAIGTDIEKLRIQVTGDAYNPYGARIAAMTSATLEIPMDCQTVREGEVFRAPDADGMGAAPRLFLRNKDGSQQWYSNTELVELTPQTPLTAKQYLFVFVCLENYNRGRDGWIEGSSYIDNDVELTLGEACEDLAENELNDLSAVVEPVEFRIVKDGVVPDVQGSTGCVISVNVTAAGTVPLLDENHFATEIEQFKDELAPSNSYAGICSAFGRLKSGDVRLCDISECAPRRSRRGVGFCVRQANDIEIRDASGNVFRPRVITLTAASTMIPFPLPENERAGRIVFDWSAWLASHSVDASTKFNFWIRYDYVTEYPSETLMKSGIYDAKDPSVDGWELLKTCPVSDGASGEIAIDGSRSVATVLMTAYSAPDSVPHVTTEFAHGTGDIFYNDMTPDAFLPVSPSDYPAFDRSRSYAPGDRVSMQGEYRSSQTASISGRGVMFLGSIVAYNYIGGKDRIQKSDDYCETWEDVECFEGSDPSTCDSFPQIVVSGGKLFIYGERGSTMQLSITDDLVSFTRSSNPFNDSSQGNTHLEDVYTKSGVLCAIVRNVSSGSSPSYYSTDGGQTWHSSGLVFNINGSKEVNGVIFISSNAAVLYASKNGIDWTQLDFKGDSTKFVGFNGMIVCSGSGVVRTSNDGFSWTEIQTGHVSTQTSHDVVVYGGALYVLIRGQGSAVIVKSYDTITWQTVANISGLAIRFAVGRNGFAYSTRGSIYYSPDGETWRKVVTNESDTSYAEPVEIGLPQGWVFMLNDSEYSCLSSNASDWDLLEYGEVLVRLDDGTFVFRFGYSIVFMRPRATAYMAVESVSPGNFNPSQWRIVENVNHERMNGAANLCVPDITLIC